MSDERTQLSLRDLVDLEAWLDESFRDEVLADPGAAAAKVAEKYGIDLPEGVQFRAVADSETQYNLVLSANPAGEAPAATASEVRAYGMDLMGLPPDPDPVKRGSSYSLFCNPAICKAISTYRPA